MHAFLASSASVMGYLRARMDLIALVNAMILYLLRVGRLSSSSLPEAKLASYLYDNEAEQYFSRAYLVHPG